MLSSGMKCIIWDEMLKSGASVIIWDKMLLSGMKCYHLGCNVIIWSYVINWDKTLSSGMKCFIWRWCYHLGRNVIIWDEMLSSGFTVREWHNRFTLKYLPENYFRNDRQRREFFFLGKVYGTDGDNFCYIRCSTTFSILCMGGKTEEKNTLLQYSEAFI